MEQKTFEEIKEELLLRAKKAGACQIGYAMGLRSQCKADILRLLLITGLGCYEQQE